MVSIVGLLVLACALTINAQNPNSQCNPVQIGVVPTPKAVKLQPVNLAPNLADWQITIPPIQDCTYGVSGVQAFVCDGDIAPSGYFSDFNTLMAHRNGNLQYVGSILVTLQVTRASNDVSSFQLLARLSFPTVETKPYNMPTSKELDPHHSYAEEKFEKLQDYYNYMNGRVKEPHNPTERSEILDIGSKKLFSFIDAHLKDMKRLLYATDMALMSMVLLKLNKKMDTSEAKIKSTQAKIPFGLYTSPEFKCLDTSYYIVSAHNQEDAQMILSSERKPHCYTFRGAFAFIGFYHRHSETTYVGPHAEQFQAKDPSQGLYCHSDDNWSDAQCIYKINPREEFPESVEYEPKVSYFCGPYRYFIPATTDVRCIFSIFAMNFVFRFGYDGVTYKSSDLSFMYQNGQVFYTDEPWAGMSCWNWACKWRHNQNQRSNEFFVN